MNSQSFELMKGRPVIHRPTPHTRLSPKTPPLFLSSLSSGAFPLLRAELGSILTGLYLSASQCPLLEQRQEIRSTPLNLSVIPGCRCEV